MVENILQVSVLCRGGVSARVGGAAAEVEPSSGVGVDGRGCWEESPFLSTLTFDLPGVLALTRRSCVKVGRGLTTMGRKGVSLSK